MLDEVQKKYIDFLKAEPYKVANWLGFSGITKDLHNEWIKSLVFGKEDWTLQAHRGSYKTTCVSVAFAIYMILHPNRNIIFMRKTDDDVTEIIEQVRKILESDVLRYITFKIYRKDLKIIKSNSNEITTNLSDTTRGAVQLLGLGIKGSLTGKHAYWVHTDDIVNIKDRVSRAEREYTKSIYMELQNIKMVGGRITNTGTPWHKDDCFSLMPAAERYDVYSTGLLGQDEIDELRKRMTPSLFAANYELKHIANENTLLNTPPKFVDDVNLVRQGRAHIDASYGGEDGSVLTIANRIGDKIYVLGKRRQGHIDSHLNEFLSLCKAYQAGVIRVEDNGDKGYLAKEIIKRGGYAKTYHEDMNKYIKISTYLKAEWDNVYFLRGTDEEYIDEILDYSEDAAHDDSPDSLACVLRDYKNTGIKGF